MERLTIVKRNKTHETETKNENPVLFQIESNQTLIFISSLFFQKKNLIGFEKINVVLLVFTHVSSSIHSLIQIYSNNSNMFSMSQCMEHKACYAC